MLLTILSSHLLTVREMFTLCYIKIIFLFKNIEKKDEYQYLHKKGDELPGDNIENESCVEYGTDFTNFKIFTTDNKHEMYYCLFSWIFLFSSNYYFH